MNLNKPLLKSKMALVGMTDQKMADLLGVSKSSISRRFSGEVSFTAPEIKLIKDYLKLTDKEINLIFLQ